MGGFFAEKQAARTAVHEYMSRPGLYIPDIAFPSTNTPVTVRVHERWTEIGNLKGTSFHFAEREEVTPRLVFWVSEIVPDRLAVVSVAAGEAYRVETVEPKDGLSVTANVVRLSAAEAAGLPVPP